MVMAEFSTTATMRPLTRKRKNWGWRGNEMVKVDRDIMVLAQPGNRQPALLGDRVGCSRWYRRGAFDRRGFVVGHIFLHQSRSLEGRFSKRDR